MPQRPLRLNLSNYYYTTTWFGGQQDISVFFRNALNIFQAWKAPLPNLCVIAHFIGRGACIYCRLLSVLPMQIIKFGGKSTLLQYHISWFLTNTSQLLHFTARSASSWGQVKEHARKALYSVISLLMRLPFSCSRTSPYATLHNLPAIWCKSGVVVGVVDFRPKCPVYRSDLQRNGLWLPWWLLRKSPS